MNLKQLKNIVFYFILILPYIISSLLLFFSITNNDEILKRRIDNIQTTLGFDMYQFIFFIGIIIFISTIITLVFVFILLKIVLLIVDREKEAKDRDLFFSLIVGFTTSNILALVLNDLLDLNISTITLITPIVDIMVFTSLYYYFSRNKKNSITLLTARIIIFLFGLIFLS